MPGYSDRINHALAFAAKHHDQQVRRGTRAPYLTHPANVALILTRYGCDESTVVAGILHSVVEDWLRDGYTREILEQRLGEKFGSGVLEMLLAIAQRRSDDDGVELSSEERREDVVERLSRAGESARWVCAATKLHDAASLVSDLRRTVDRRTVWARVPGGRDATLLWLRSICNGLDAGGNHAPIVDELKDAVKDLEGLTAD